MSAITPQSQRNNPNASDILGFGKQGQTIRDYGCTITCIAMFAGITPGEVNQRLKNVLGFNESMVVWTKLEAAISWIRFVWRNRGYNDARVSQAVKEHGACLVEVDFDGTPRTDDRHWVLFTGNQKMNDPWTGTVRSTNTYGQPTGFAILQRIGNPPGGAMAQTISIDIPTWERVRNNSETLDSVADMLGVARTQNGQPIAIDKNEVLKRLTDLKNKADKPVSSPSSEVLSKADLEAAVRAINDNMYSIMGRLDITLR